MNRAVVRGSYAGILLCALAIRAAADTRYVVQPDGSGDFPTIQAAIFACTHGDTILLGDGVFRGEGNRDLRYQGRSITIRSLSGRARSCVIDCESTPGAEHRGISFDFGEGPGARLMDVTIRNGDARRAASPRGGAIEIRHASPQILRCVFLSNRASYGGAIACRDDSAPLIRDCWFEDNHGHHGAGAVDLDVHCSIVIKRCVFLRNESVGPGAALSCAYSNPIVSGCVFADNAGLGSPAIGVWNASVLRMDTSIVAFTRNGPGILCEDSGANLACCDVFGNDHGDWIDGIASQSGENGNLCADPRFCDLARGVPAIAIDSPCAASQNPECGRIGPWQEGCPKVSVNRPGDRPIE